MALAAVAVVILLAQIVPRQSIDDVAAERVRSASTSTTVASTSTTVAPTATAPSPAAALAAELRAGAARFGPGDGAAAPDLATRLRAVADQVERGELNGASSATNLIVDVALWRQAGQLTDGATVAAIQLLQKVPGVAIAGSAPAVTAAPPAPTGGSPEVFVPTGDDLKGKPDKDKDKGNGRGDDD